MAVIYYNQYMENMTMIVHEAKLIYSCWADETQSSLPSATHAHKDTLELQYISRGRANIRIGTHRYQVSEGDVVVYNAGMMHDEWADASEGMCFYNCGISNLRLPGLPDNHLLNELEEPILHTGNLRETVEAIFRGLYEQLKDVRSGGELVSHCLLEALLAILLHQIPHNRHRARGNSDILLRAAQKYMDEHYMENLTIDQLCQLTHLSTSGFAHQFKKRMGIAPLQYIIQRRIGCAQMLLIQTDKSITDISIEVGYDSLSHFNNQFRKMVGMSPQSYRKVRVGREQYKKLDEICGNMTNILQNV